MGVLCTNIDKYKSKDKFDKAYFSINKNNTMSNKTFAHLGAKIFLEKEKSCKYEILKSDVEKYIQSLTKK